MYFKKLTAQQWIFASEMEKCCIMRTREFFVATYITPHSLTMYALIHCQWISKARLDGQTEKIARKIIEKLIYYYQSMKRDFYQKTLFDDTTETAGKSQILIEESVRFGLWGSERRPRLGAASHG